MAVILWCDGPYRAGENMRRDAALLAAAEAGAEPVLRLFQFEGSAITLGLSQSPERELDLERCAAAGVEWAVRPTGGRAIFHDQEWTYALAAPRDHPDWSGGLAEAFRRASTLVVRSLLRLGVPAEFAAAHEPRGRTTLDGGAAPPCFASAARHEVVLGGRKLVGSAQRRTARALLQQGSVLLGSGHLRIADFLRGDAAQRERVRDDLRAATATAAAWLGETPPLERWAEALRAELGAGTRIITAAEGAERLTVPTGRSYTAASSR